MDIRKLQRAIVDGLEDVKAQHIAVFNTEHLSSMFERVIIASGTSNRQTKALAASVRNSVKERGMQVMSTEGEDNGEWIIVDCGAAVAHIMQPSIREYYHLEEIWGGKSVRMKVGEVSTKLVKASEPAGGAAKKATPAKKAAPSRKAVKAELEKKAANRSAAHQRVAAKQAPARRSAAKTAPAKAAPRRAVARKAPTRG
jgi:ribosome-associated protein